MEGTAPPRRSNTATRINERGEKVEEWVGSTQPGIRTHDHADEEEINRKLFGTGATGQSTTTTYTDEKGDKVQAYSGQGSGPSIRTHDYSDEAAINEKLFGKSAPKPPPRTQTYKYRNADGDEEEVHAGGEQLGIRTHDQSNEDEINQRLFGAAYKST
jgi:hypothetical protein